MIKRAQLRHFMALVDEGTVTAAAARLHITQPTLSVSLAELERQSGTLLFLRERRRIRLTEAGHRLLAHARAIEREFQAAESGLSPPRDALAPLRLGLLASLATSFVADLASRLGADRPIALVEGGDAELRYGLQQRRLDAVITVLGTGDTGDGICSLFEEAYALLVAQSSPLAGKSMVDPATLGSEAMIARRSCELLAETSRFFTLRGVRPQFALRSVQDDRCLALVAAGVGITTGPVSLVRAGVVAVPLSGYAYRRRIGIISHDLEKMPGLRVAGRSAAGRLSNVTLLG